MHGDLTGNVLAHPGLPPAVIDLSAYWRPVELGTAVVVADALVWHGAGAELAAELLPGPHGGQLLVRALLCRAVTEVAGAPPDAGSPACSAGGRGPAGAWASAARVAVAAVQRAR